MITSEYTDKYESIYYATLIDTETDALLGKHELNAAVKALCDADISLYYFNYDLDLLAIAPDGSGLVFAVSDFFLFQPEEPVVSRLFYLDIGSGDIRRLCTVPDYVYEMNMIGNYLAFCTSYDFMSFAGADTVNYSNPINFYVFDLKKNKVVHRIEESKYDLGYEYRIEPIYYGDGELDTDAAVFIAGNYCEAIELSTGKVLIKYDFGSPVVKSSCREDGITAILRNGNVASVDYSDPRVPGQSHFFCNDIEDICFPDGYIYVLTSDRVLRYELGTYDKGYTSLDTLPDADYGTFLYEPDRAESRFYLLKDDVLYITDTRKNECSHAALPFAGDECDESTLLGTSPDGRCFYVKRSPYQYDWEAEAGAPAESEYYIVSLQDGSVSVSAEVIKAESGISVIDSFYYNGALYYAAAAEDGGSILLYSWIPGEERAEKLGSYDVPDGYSYFQASLKADSECVCFALRGDADNGCILVGFDAADKKFLTTDDNGEMPTQFIRDAYLWDVSRGAAIYMLCTTQSDGTEDVSLHISDVDGGHVIAKLPSAYGADDVRMLAQSPDGRLFAVMSDSVIEYSYTGEILSEVELKIALGDTVLYDETVCQFVDGNAMALSSSRVTVILDLNNDSIEAEAYVIGGLGYDAVENRIIVYSTYATEDTGSPLGSLHRYSTAELIAMGEAALG